MIATTFIMLIAFPTLICCVAGDDDVVFNNSVGVLLTSSECCFVNESTIRINDSDVNIINNTGDWIIASSGIDLFMAPANGTNCTSTTSSVVLYSDTVYIIQIVIFVATILVCFANVALHLFIKELQTISGALIASLCVSILLNVCFVLVQTAMTDQTDGEVCAVMFYIAIFPYFLYDSSKLSTLIYFTYLMYHSYKTSNVIPNAKSILCTYTILIVVLSIICSASVILVDIFVNKAGFKTTRGRCTLFIDPSNYGSASVVLLSMQFTIFNVVEIGLMIAGLVLYYLTTRQCCSRTTTDVKISIVLNCTIGINTGLVVIFYYLQIAGDINYAISSSGTLIEQLLLFCVFVTSSKVLSHLHCNMISDSSIASTSELKEVKVSNTADACTVVN